MKPKPTFKSAKLKIERADHHIRDLQRQVDTFTRENLHVIDSYADVGVSKLDIMLSFAKEPPDEIALTIGDAIHNLRTALDHMVWELIGYDGGTQNHWLKFPMGDNRTNFESACKGIKTSSSSLIDMFKAFEAFPGGAWHFLYVLNSLDNADKHTVLTPIVQVSRIDRLVLHHPDGREPIILGPITAIDENRVGGVVFSLTGFPDGYFYDFDSDAKITPDVFFGDVEFVKQQPIFPTLAQLRDAALETIWIVEKSIA